MQVRQVILCRVCPYHPKRRTATTRFRSRRMWRFHNARWGPAVCKYLQVKPTSTYFTRPNTRREPRCQSAPGETARLEDMKTYLGIILGILACLLLAGGAYFWATGIMDSLYAYRSSLRDSPPAPGQPLGQPITRRVVFVLVDALRLDTSLQPDVMPFLNELRQQGAWATMHSRPPSYSAPAYSVLVVHQYIVPSLIADKRCMWRCSTASPAYIAVFVNPSRDFVERCIDVSQLVPVSSSFLLSSPFSSPFSQSPFMVCDLRG
jgi:hypothetical protein